MSADVFDAIREACAEVALGARHVFFEGAALPACARRIAPAIASPAYDTSLHFSGRLDDTVSYIVTLDAINFGSGYFPHFRKRHGLSGYGTLASTLSDVYRSRGPLTADELSHISPADCARLFGQEITDPAIAEWAALVAQAWNDLGSDLLRRFSGSAVRLVEAADGSAAKLIDLLDAQPLFRDVAICRGAAVPLYKRSQILASDLALALGGADGGAFKDLDRLTIFADNLVPHVLRCEGILRYADSLATTIERQELLPAGSEAEVEIRACAIFASEALVLELRGLGIPATPRLLDIALWNRGQEPDLKARFPRHRTRTPYY